MRGLLSGAAFNTQYNKQYGSGQRYFFSDYFETMMEHFETLIEHFEKLQDALLQQDDLVPMLGTVCGLLFGTIFIYYFFCFWLKPSVSKEQKDVYNFMSAISRGNGDASKYTKPKSRKGKSKTWMQWFFGSSGKFPATASSVTFPKGHGCYLVYEPDQGGRLVQWFSKTPLDPEENSILAFWKTQSHISILNFQENDGRKTLVINCQVGFQGRHKYCNGVCQFIKGAFSHGEPVITMMPNLKKGKKASSSYENDDDFPRQLLPIDVYLYQHDNRPSHQTLTLRPLKGMPIPSSHSLKAVACLPHKTSFYKNLGVELSQWMADGERYGSSVHI